MHARRMPFMTPALFLVFAFSAASAAENAAPLPAPLPAPGSPSKPRRNRTVLTMIGTCAISDSLTKGVSLKSSRRLAHLH